MTKEKLCIGVTGVTGKTGKAVLAALSANHISHENIESIKMIFPFGADKKSLEVSDKHYHVTEFDLNNQAFRDDLRQLDIIMVIPGTLPLDQKIEETTSLLQAVSQAKVKNVLLLSMMQPEHASKSAIGKGFGEIEKLCSSKFSNLNCVILQAGFYTQNLFLYRPHIINENLLPLPMGDSKFAPIDIHDVGLIAAKLLTDPDLFQSYAGSKICVTGPTLMTGQDIADSFSKILGKPILYRNASETEAKQNMLMAGVSDFEVEEVLDFFRICRNYDGFDRVSAKNLNLMTLVEGQNFLTLEQSIRLAGVIPGRNQKLWKNPLYLYFESITFLPDPIVDSKNDQHYLPFQDLIDTGTSDDSRPSVIMKDAKETTQFLESLDWTNQHFIGQTARDGIKCSVCNMS